MPCENVVGHMRTAPRSACTSTQSDQAFAVCHWTLKEVSMESKYPDETLHMYRMNLNLCILRMFEDTFSLDVAHVVVLSVSGAMTEENLKVKQQLKRSFSVLKKCVETWEEANDTTRKVIEKVADFADQYQCCSKVEVCDLEIGKKFPDLQERLLFQIASEADLLFTQLQKQLWVQIYYLTYLAC